MVWVFEVFGVQTRARASATHATEGKDAVALVAALASAQPRARDRQQNLRLRHIQAPIRHTYIHKQGRLGSSDDYVVRPAIHKSEVGCMNEIVVAVGIIVRDRKCKLKEVCR